MIDDQFKDIPKNNSDILGLRNMTSETITRLTKGTDVRVKGMICKISRPAHVAPDDDKWRHEKSDSDYEDQRMSVLVEKKTRWWFEKEKAKRKRTPKTAPTVSVPNKPVPKIVVKGTSVEPQQRLIDETVIDPSGIPQDAIDLTKVTLEQFIQLNEAAGAAQKDQGSSVHAKTIKEPEGVVQDDFSEEADSEATVSESELDPTTLGRGKAQLKKKPTKSRKHQMKKTLAMYLMSQRNKERSVKLFKLDQFREEYGQRKQITGYKAATPPPPPPPQDQPESSHQKDTSFDYLFERLPTATGIYKEDTPEEDYDMFNNEAVKELIKKVAELEKEKAKAEAERDVFKRQIEELMKAHDEARMVLIDQEETKKKMKDDVHDNSQLFKLLSAEISTLNVKIKNLQNVNQTLNQLLSEMSEASSNEMKVMKLEMEAMKADKVMKDNQLNMLYAVIQSHLKIDVHAAFNKIDVKRVEERIIQRERELAQEATQRRKAVVVDAEAGGSSSVADVEMTEAEADPLGFVLVGESSESLDLTDILHRVHVLQKKKKAKEVLVLEWKKEQVEEETPNFILIGKASSVPYSIKEIVRQIKVKERRRKAKIARGEIVEDDSDKELFV
ncbi:hypothetical protein Hanom_Chr00s000002g01600521 [Helianthus anomalus]